MKITCLGCVFKVLLREWSISAWNTSAPPGRVIQHFSVRRSKRSRTISKLYKFWSIFYAKLKTKMGTFIFKKVNKQTKRQINREKKWVAFGEKLLKLVGKFVVNFQKGDHCALKKRDQHGRASSSTN